MKKSTEKLKFGGIAIDLADQRSKEIAKHVVELLADVEPERLEKTIAFLISDELVHSFFDTVKSLLRDEGGRAWITALSSTMNARKGANLRAESGVKYKFLEWALEQNARNPALSKNAIAAAYARDHPGTSTATLRRYLAEIPFEGGGD